ncbi:isoprenylcysteine carboxylmethyltransferase family protein [Caballeronia sp. M1242]|uniref:methyltransferase family protein n=1 Tax=Caballeronia sp. M1242 TaxID=2814653 RepID=UPI0019D14A25|nr:isoprenylcysteine carboxylmethyltransferase family protein [Caballeronia sp. M1242]QSN62996.1 isoprenylcysteine carboxylmethyltransferase family protein [Caballeronia sp. M1242]
MNIDAALRANPVAAWLQAHADVLVEAAIRIVTVATLGLFLYGSLVQFWRDPSRVTVLLMVLSEVVTIVFSLLSRVPGKRDWNVLSVMVSSVATFYFLAFDIKPGIHLIPEWVAVCLQVIGMSVQISAKLSLRRSFGILPANRGVVVHGPYKLIRHPMYFGYLIKDIGFLLPNFGLQNVIVLVVHWTLQVTRIVREERLLSEDDTYREYAKRVRYRLIAGIF